MTRLLLPPRVEREILKDKWRQQRAEQRAMIGRLLDFDDPACREWQPVLQRMDPLLKLGRARPQAYEPGYNVRPGFYHWVRFSETAAPTVQPITGPDGESFAVPDSGLLRQLAANDLQDPVVFRALVERHERREQEQEREREMDRQERQQEVLERWKAGTRAQVLLSDDVAWSQNAAGRRGART